MDIQTLVAEHIRDHELDIDRVLRACVVAVGLQTVLEELGTLFGNAGQEEPEACAACGRSDFP